MPIVIARDGPVEPVRIGPPPSRRNKDKAWQKIAFLWTIDQRIRRIRLELESSGQTQPEQHEKEA